MRIIRSASVFGVECKLAQPIKKSKNQFSVLTGPNGVGKSRLLAAMASFAGREVGYAFRTTYPGVDLAIGVVGKIVAQTFSPFSKFPAVPKLRRQALLEHWQSIEDTRYAVVGMSKTTQFPGSASKAVLVSLLPKMAKSDAVLRPLREALSYLEFEPSIQFTFELVPSLRMTSLSLSRRHNFDSSMTEQEIYEFAEDYVNSITNKQNLTSEEKRLTKELSLSEKRLVVNTIAEALSTIRGYHGTQNGFELMISLENHLTPVQKSALAASFNLNRLGLYRVAKCKLTKKDVNQLGGYRFLDIADTSSGEQQLLCSIIGLVSEVEDNSLVLIDEPELSLHPEWQSRFISLLVDALSPYKGCEVFIATHSPLIAQGAIEKGMPVTSLGPSSPDSEILPSSKPSVESALLEIFGTPVRNSDYVSNWLLSTVLEAQSPNADRNAMLTKLNWLEARYLQAEPVDEVTVQLIKDAKQLVISEPTVEASVNSRSVDS